MKDAQELIPLTDQELSPRVLAAIKHTQAVSEILLSWTQVGFLTFMAFLYFIAPKGFNTDVRFEPVPIMLALYAPFVLLRLGLALKERLTPFILYGLRAGRYCVCHRVDLCVSPPVRTNHSLFAQGPNLLLFIHLYCPAQPTLRNALPSHGRHCCHCRMGLPGPAGDLGQWHNHPELYGIY